MRMPSWSNTLMFVKLVLHSGHIRWCCIADTSGPATGGEFRAQTDPELRILLFIADSAFLRCKINYVIIIIANKP